MPVVRVRNQTRQSGPQPWRAVPVQAGVIREGVSKGGRAVRLSLDCGTYEGARPYYTVAYLRQDGRKPQVARYTPFRDRAEWLFERFCQDVIDPTELGVARDVAAP